MVHRSIASVLLLIAGSATAFAAGNASQEIARSLSLQAGDQAFLVSSDSAPVVYYNRPGITELQGKMIIRPITREDWLARGLTAEDADARISRARARLAPIQWQFVDVHNHVLVTLPQGVDENQMSAFLIATGDYQYAEPDYIVYPTVIPNDSSYTNAGMYAHWVCDAEEAWDITTGSASVIVGVTDTGVRTDHQDLAPNLVSGANSATGGAIAQSDGGQVEDLNGHGSHTAGIVGARGNNSLGVAGMSWTNSIMPIRVSDSAGGSAPLSAIQAGATYAASHGARVVSTSYSGVNTASNQTVGATLRTNYNALWFWAAGNANSDLGADSYADLQIIASTDSSDLKSSFSNFGAAVDIAAPGSNIYSTYWGASNAYTTLSGTSMACPAAAGAAGLVVSVNPSLTAVQVRDILFNNVDDLGATGEDNTFGRGRLNVGKAVADAYRISFPTTLPFVDSFESGSFANTRWVFRETGTSVSTSAVGEPSGTFSAMINMARRIETNAINLAGNSSPITLTFATEARGPAAGESMAVEYLNSSGIWVNLATYTSTGVAESSFTQRSISIPTGAAARHAKFSVRFKAAGNATGDQWFIDDVRIGTPTCAADFNNDGSADFFDYLDFVDAFAANLPSADFNHDGSIDFFDYLDFVDVFSVGC